MSHAHLDERLLIETFDTLAAQSVTWLWLGRLARGKLAIFEGDPGLGKSLVALDLAARLSRGQAFPEDALAPAPGKVLLFTGEDVAEDTVVPRLQALGVDCAKIMRVQRCHDLGPEPLCFPAHVPLLERVLERERPALVIFDPIMSFLDRTVATGDDGSVRRALWPLALLAESTIA